nr:Peptide G protein-coupled receptor [Hymenolepis microstoma]
MVSCIFAFAVICNLPRVFEHIPIKIRVFNSTSNCETIEETRLGEQDLYVKLYVSYGYTFGIFVIPVGIVSVLNARLGSLLHRVRQEFSEKKDDNPESSNAPCKIRRDKNQSILQDGRSEISEIQFRGQHGSLKDKSNIRMTHARARVTGRLFCLVSVFIAFQSLPMIDNLIIAFMSEPKETIPNYDDFYAICQFSVLVNSSINTVLYCFLGQRFRAAFWKMIHRWLDYCYTCFKLVSCQLCSLTK